MLIPFSKQRIQKIPTQFTVAFSPFMILVDSLSSIADPLFYKVSHTPYIFKNCFTCKYILYCIQY